MLLALTPVTASEGYYGEVGLETQEDLAGGLPATLRGEPVLFQHLDIAEEALERAPRVDSGRSRRVVHELNDLRRTLRGVRRHKQQGGLLFQ